MSILSLPMSLDDLELAWLKESYCEGYGKTGKCICLRNYIRNPGAEVDLTNFSQVNGATVTRDTSVFYSGVASYKIVAPGSVALEGGYFNATNLPNGSTSAGSVRVKASVGDALMVQFRITYSDASNNQNQVTFTADGTWQLITTTGLVATPGKTVSAVQVIVRCQGTLATTIWVDNGILSVSNSVPEYFDGSTPDNNVYTYDWEGTPHNSSSIKWAKEPIYAENLIVDPYFVNKNTNPTFGGWALYKSSIPPISVFDSEIPSPPPCGGPVLKVVNDGTASAYCYIAASWAGVGGAGANAIRQGVTYTLSYYIRQRSGTPTTCGLLSVSNVAGSNAAFPIAANSSGGAISSEWKRVVRTGVAAVDNAIDNIIWISIPNGVWEIEIAGVAINIGSNPVVIPQEMAVWRGSVSNSPSAMYDVNARDLAYIEKNYWAKLSGLSEPASLADHKLAALRANIKTVAGDPLMVTRRNYEPNPGFEVNLSTFLPNNYTATRDTVDFEPTSGSSSAKLVVNTANVACKFSRDLASAYKMPVSPGDMVVASCYYKTSAGAKSISFIVYFVDDLNNIMGQYSVALTANTSWSRKDVTQIAPAGATQVLILDAAYMGPGVAVPGDTYWLDNLMLEKTNSIGSYFDGNTSSLTRWSGTANLSMSEMVDASTHGITDLWVSYLMSRSGLSPASKWSLADHEFAFYKSQLGL